MKNPYLSLLATGAIAALLPLAPLSAQTAADPAAKPPKGPNVEEKVAKMKENLALTDDQVTAVKAIFEDQKTKMDAIKADAALTKEQKREKAQPIMEETKTKVDALLTPEQKTKADQLRKERAEKRKTDKAQQ